MLFQTVTSPFVETPDRSAPPGSWAKVAVMAARAANGETVNHPGDATDWTDFGHLAAAMMIPMHQAAKGSRMGRT